MIIENGFDVIEVQWVSMMLLLLLDGGTIKATTWFTNFPSKLRNPAVITTFTFNCTKNVTVRVLICLYTTTVKKGPYIAKWTNQKLPNVNAHNDRSRCPQYKPKGA